MLDASILFLLTITLFNAAALGSYVQLRRELRLSRNALAKALLDFESIAKAASESSTSQASKLIELSERVDNIQMAAQSIQSSRNSSQFPTSRL